MKNYYDILGVSEDASNDQIKKAFKSIAKKELGDKRKDLELTVLNGLKESSQPIPGELIKIIRSGKFNKTKTLKLKSYDLIDDLQK